MQSRIHQFEIGISRNIPVFEARDTDSGEEVLLYEWTPAIKDRAAAKERLVEIAASLEQEVFTVDASIFLVNRSQAATERTLSVLRENGLFPSLQITAGARSAELTVAAAKLDTLPAPSVKAVQFAVATPVTAPVKPTAAVPLASFASESEKPKKKMRWTAAFGLAFLLYLLGKVIAAAGFGIFLAIGFLLLFAFVRFIQWASAK